MKPYFVLFILMAFFTSNVQSQYVVTDSMDLGEDRTSHAYAEYNPSGDGTIKIGVYECNGNKAITIGGNNEGDSIIFYLSVTPNVNEIKVSWNFSWFNAGTNIDMYPQLVIEDKIEGELYSAGQNAVGSDPKSCDMSLHELVFKDVAKYTADGKVKIKIYDAYPAFAGNASICKFKVFSAGSSNINKHYPPEDVKVFPNPFSNSFVIESPRLNAEEVNIQLFDVLGNEHTIHVSETTNRISIQTENLTKGMYFVKISNKSKGEILWYQKVNKE